MPTRFWKSLIGFGVLGVLLANVLLAVAQDPTPTLPPVQDRDFDLGIHIRETQPSVDESVLAGYFDAARNQLKLNWVRLKMRWDFVQPTAEDFNWASWDSVFRLAANHNLKVLLTISGAPAWAVGEAAATDAVIMPPQDATLYADFVVRVLQRYPNQIHAIEIWEGMNIHQLWASPDGVNPAHYTELVATTSSRIRNIDPNIILISGGLESTSGGDVMQAIDDFTYLDGMLQTGLLDWVDCVGVHHNGYNIPPDVPFDAVPADDSATFRGPFESPHHSWSFYSTLQTYARKIAVTGYQTPLCVTEFGWASAADFPTIPENGLFAADNTLEEHAQWTLQAINAMQEWNFVWLAFLWNLNIAPEVGFQANDVDAAYSLIRPNFALSPAWVPIAELNFRSR